MTLDDIKLRQLTNLYLITPGKKLTVARDLCGVQAQFMTNALHSMKIRCSDYMPETAAEGLVKNWTIRGTVHVFAESDLPLFKHCDNGKSYRLDEWYGFVHHITREWTLTPERQKYFSHVILDTLKDGAMTREELKEVCLENGMTEIEKDSMFDQWGGGIRDMCERGFMCYVVQEKKAFCLSPSFTPISEKEAALETARRYFTNYGPATVKDAMYFFHTTKTQVMEWLDSLPVTACECGKKVYYYIENGKRYDKPMPDCVFLAGFDNLMLGYQKSESLYLPQEHLRQIFNLAGIVMPAVLLNGKVVGKWRKKGTVLNVTLFESVSEKDKKLISDTSEKLWSDIKRIDIQ
jgi:hypothetical protein